MVSVHGFSISINIANFEAFGQSILLSANLLFLKSVMIIIWSRHTIDQMSIMMLIWAMHTHWSNEYHEFWMLSITRISIFYIEILSETSKNIEK